MAAGPLAPRTAVVVLGDLGRSPRMLYQALALADHLGPVDLIGYGDSPLPVRLREHPRLAVHLLPASRPRQQQRLSGPAFITRSAARVVAQSLRLLRALRALPPFQLLLVQSPPAIPTLLVASVVARLRSAKLVIDWHNFGYSMLGLRLGSGHIAVRAARRVEGAAGRRGDAHLCVSAAMREELARLWGIDGAVVLRDRPADGFAPAPAAARREAMRRLGIDDDAHTALAVSPTSWTADEDFALLLEAAVRYDEMMRAYGNGERHRPPLLLAITGEGPGRSEFEAQCRRLALSRVRIRTAWLPPEEYPAFVGAADLGICLHRSASGFDLPMKVADMLGAGLPVLAYDYGRCIAEVLRPGENGMLFSDANGLAQRLWDVLEDFPGGGPLLRLRRQVRELHLPHWSEEWREHALPLFSACAAGRQDSKAAP